jgi:hypothetical protein
MKTLPRPRIVRVLVCFRSAGSLAFRVGSGQRFFPCCNPQRSAQPGLLGLLVSTSPCRLPRRRGFSVVATASSQEPCDAAEVVFVVGQVVSIRLPRRELLKLALGGQGCLGPQVTFHSRCEFRGFAPVGFGIDLAFILKSDVCLGPGVIGLESV